MEQILLAYGIPKETVAAITILYRNTKVKVRSPDGDTEYFDSCSRSTTRGHAGSVSLYHLSRLRTLEHRLTKSKRMASNWRRKEAEDNPATTITDADYADDIAILANTPDQAETLLHSLERAAAMHRPPLLMHTKRNICAITKQGTSPL